MILREKKSQYSDTPWEGGLLQLVSKLTLLGDLGNIDKGVHDVNV